MDREIYLKAYFFIQPDYYLDVYKSYKAGEKFNFNIWPFLFGIFWFLYRKLWFEAMIILLIYLFIFFVNIGIIESDKEWLINTVINFITATVFGFVGNYFYLKNAEKQINKVLSTTLDEKERIKILNKKGGVSLAPYIFLFLILSIMIVWNAFQN